MVKNREDATLVPVRSPAKEFFKETIDDPLLKDKQKVFEATGKTCAITPASNVVSCDQMEDVSSRHSSCTFSP